MKFLFISVDDGCVHNLAAKIKNEGHEVLYHILEKSCRDIGEGIIESVDNWEDYKDWADVIILVDVNMNKIRNKLCQQKKLVIGGTAYADKLEIDRYFSIQEMKKAGLTPPPSYKFSNFKKAITFIKRNPKRYVVKIGGILPLYDKTLCYIGREKNGLDVVAILEQYKKNWSERIDYFLLQEFISGIEVAMGAFFNGKKFITPFLINFEHKKMFNNDLGPTTGEMGTVGLWAEKNKLYNETLAKMLYRIQGFKGYFDMNCIVNETGVYPLDITPRFGYPTIDLQMEGIHSNWGEFLYALAKGESYSLKTRTGIQIAVVIAVPPYPFDNEKLAKQFSRGLPIIVTKSDLKIYPYDVKMIKEQWIITGTSGYVLVVTGSGPTVKKARYDAYHQIKYIFIPNMFYRTDIGQRCARNIRLLKKWNYI